MPGEAVPEGMAALLQQHYTQGSGPTYIPVGAGTIRNCTDLPDSEVAAEAAKPLPFSVEVGSSEPQVLIMHTHATECYESEEHSWCDPAFTARTTDTAANMVAVGEEMAAVLNAAGIATVHDTTLHDYPATTAATRPATPLCANILRSTRPSRWCWTCTATPSSARTARA